MMLFVLLGVAVVAWLVWQPSQRVRWKRAEASVAERLSLGTDGIARGAEPIAKGDFGRAALLLHGFGDTPQSLRYLADRLHDAGWTVCAPLLPGHGRTLAAFHASRAADWLQLAAAKFDDLAKSHENVVVCGQSMGAALALELAVTKPVSRLALLAPYIELPWSVRAAATGWPVFNLLLPLLRTQDRRSIQDQAAGARSLAYGYTTPRLLSQLAYVVRRARRHLGDIRIPTLIVHSREDNRVTPAAVQRAASSIAHPVTALHWVSGCGHVLTADYCKEAVAALVVDWFERTTVIQDTPAAAR